MWTPAGVIGPLQPKSSRASTVLLVMTAAVFATTGGYDSGLMTGINIMPSYTEFLKLTPETRSLNVSANFIGWGVASLTMGPVINKIGRKNSILLSLLIKFFAVGLITGARNVGMFLSGRIILGIAKGIAGIAGSTWLAETLPPKIRGFGLSITFSVYYVGALLAAGVTYRTAEISGEWSWRLPCLLQSVFAIFSGVCVFFTPESPRWLAYRDQTDDVLRVLASMGANGDVSDPEVLRQYQELVDGRDWERSQGKTLSFAELFRTPTARRRLMLALSVAVLAMGSGNNIASYFLGDMLAGAGLANKTVQLQINIVMNAWCLVCSITGTFLMDRVGRKTLCLVAITGMSCFMLILGGLTKAFSKTTDLAGIYGTVASIFMFMGMYSVGITPVTQLYPPEIMNYSIRSNGMALWAGTIAIFAILTTFTLPLGLKAISWRLYMIIGAWNILETIFVAFFWVETKGLSLEQIDKLFEGSNYGIYQGSGESFEEINIGTSTALKS